MSKIAELKDAEHMLDRIDKKADDAFGKLGRVITAVETLKEEAEGLPQPQYLESIGEVARSLGETLKEVTDAAEGLPDIDYFTRAGEAAQQLQNTLAEVEENQ